MKFLILHFLQLPVSSSVLGSHIILNCFFTVSLSLNSTLTARHKVSRLYVRAGKITC